MVNHLKQPNIVLITCDHLREDFLGCSGHPIAQTPHIDLLSRIGMRFTQAYSPTPICIPSRATIMTGLEAHSHGIKEYKAGFELPVSETLPKQLRDAGYQTKLIGKSHMYPERCHYGFDQMLLCEEGRRFGKAYGENRGYDDYEQWLTDQGYPGLAFAHGISNNEYAMSPWHLPDHLHPTEWIGQQTCREIKHRDWTRPQFIWASFTAPHPPLTPLMRDLYIYDKDEMLEPYIGGWTSDFSAYHDFNLYNYKDNHGKKQKDLAYRAFLALVTQVDRQINRIVGTLLEENLLSNTWIIFTSDHGDSLGDHYLWQKANFLKGACNVPLISIPLIDQEYQQKYLGEEWYPGTVCRAPVGLQDIMPTCLEIGKATCPELDGKSLIPLLKKQQDKVREVLFGEFGADEKRNFMVSDGSWKYIWYEQDGKELLFNIKKDPNELENLSTHEHSMKKMPKERLLQILIGRDDKVVKNGDLRPSNVNRFQTTTEKAKRYINEVLLKHPKGLH